MRYAMYVFQCICEPVIRIRLNPLFDFQIELCKMKVQRDWSHRFVIRHNH